MRCQAHPASCTPPLSTPVGQSSTFRLSDDSSKAALSLLKLAIENPVFGDEFWFIDQTRTDLV
uniref:Ras-associating domain-containing protein n=1 Tax=Macrostomum lignano TaxID=282301 RepID=A0A1I8F9J0_9PLAT